MEFNTKRMDDYEKIQTVGKGAFGTAVLYKKKSTNKLVVLKEISTADLSAEERQMALNEVEVLASLNHENIIGYGGSFIENGMLMIEMEFADGGTLNQLLNNKETHMPEKEVLNFLEQIASAIAHMHKNNILHRDLKTANVFLSSNGRVKIGDFGISKILSTNVQANTVLGTPYYISPEMCEGKEYGEKSDIWAMGCILYELCCLHRTFQASSLSALVNKIMQGNYKPVPSIYTKELRNLISFLLDKNPSKRPSARDVIDIWIPKILSDLEKYDGNKYFNDLSKDQLCINTRSVLYEMKYREDDIDVQPVCLPPKINIINISVGNHHYIAITDDNLVFTWGEGGKGQLGSGKSEKYRFHPLPVMALLNKNIIKAGAGEDFSLFLSSDGKVWSCGNGAFGALGHGDWTDCYEPKIIDSLISTKIEMIQCGSDHAAAVSENGALFIWGCGNKGQIGNRNTSDINSPTVIELPKKCEIFSLHLGYKASMIINTKGELYACGWNTKNRLGLFKKSCIKKSIRPALIILSLKKVCCFSGKIVSCSIEKTHCVILLKYSTGQIIIYSMGCIKKSCIESPLELMHDPVKISLSDNISIKEVKSGSTHTIISTTDNSILFWGIQHKLSSRNNISKMYEKSEVFKESDQELYQNTNITFSNYSSDYIQEPIPIMALYASKEQISKGSYILLSGIYPLKYGLFFSIEAITITSTQKDETKNGIGTDEGETIEKISAWIQADIMQSQFSWTHK